MSLDAPLSAITFEVHGAVQLAQRLYHFVKNRRQEEKVNQVRIELRAPTFQDDLRRRGCVTTRPVPTRMRDGVIRVRDAHDARAKRNLRSRQSSRIPASIPTLMMAQHAFAEVGVEARQWLEDFRAPLRVRRDQLPFTRRQLATVANDVEQCRMNFSNVVKERDPLDAAALVFIEIGRPRENQRVGRDPSQVRPGFVIVRVDGIEQRLEGRSGKALGGTTGREFPGGEDAADSAHGDTGEGAKHTLFLRHYLQARQEVGDLTSDRRKAPSDDRKVR